MFQACFTIRTPRLHGCVRGVSRCIAQRWGTGSALRARGLSCDSVDDHHAWSRDVLSAKGLQGEALDFPLIGDKDRSIAALLGMLDPLEQDPPSAARALAAMPSVVAARARAPPLPTLCAARRTPRASPCRPAHCS